MRLIPKDYMNAVVSIGVRENGSIQWIATGFFITKLVNNKPMPFLVTNRHVFRGRSSVVIRMIEKNSQAIRDIDVNVVANGIQHYYVHNNPNVDIAVAPLNSLFISNNNLQFFAFDIDSIGYSSIRVQQDFDEGTSVFMLGYPMGWVDIDSNTPICRGGYIARISREEIAKTKSFLLDIQNFPGNSGSPIITRPELINDNGSLSLNKSVLIGIIHSYIPYEEQLINSQTKKIVEIKTENSGIALVHPTELIIETIDQIVQNILSLVKG